MTSDDRIADLQRHVADLIAYNQTRTDELAASVAQVAALTKENNRLQTACNKFSESEILEGNQLAASQAREQKLREVLVRYSRYNSTKGTRCIYCHCLEDDGHNKDCAIGRELALPTDDTALQARLKDEREKCAVKCEQHGQTLGSILAAEIRSMT